MSLAFIFLNIYFYVNLKILSCKTYKNCLMIWYNLSTGCIRGMHTHMVAQRKEKRKKQKERSWKGSRFPARRTSQQKLGEKKKESKKRSEVISKLADWHWRLLYLRSVMQNPSLKKCVGICRRVFLVTIAHRNPNTQNLKKQFIILLLT